MKTLTYFRSLLLTVIAGSACMAATAGKEGGNDLDISTNGKTTAVIVISPDAGTNEKQAAKDLAKYIGLMCGAKPAIVNTDAAIRSAMASKAPKLVVGEQALKAQPKLRGKLNGVLKKNPYLRTDGIVLRRDGNRVYLAGNNDLAHYFAAAELLRRWGCRWYIPTEFGECIPEEPNLKVGTLDYAYSSPFEIRSYWISWVGDNAGRREFQMRNMMMTDRGRERDREN